MDCKGGWANKKLTLSSPIPYLGKKKDNIFSLFANNWIVTGVFTGNLAWLDF